MSSGAGFQENPQDDNTDGVVVSKIGGALGEETIGWFRKRNGDTLRGALAFVPWILQEAYFDGQLNDKAVVVHRGKGAAVVLDASGFSKLTEQVTQKTNGAEQLSQCLTDFFSPLIELINDYRGDVIKFSSDSLMVYFPDADDTKSPQYNRIVPPHGTYGLPDLGPMPTAVLRASACSIEIHKRLHEFDTGVDNIKLCLRIGVGCGIVNILQCGGVIPPETHVPRYEYIIAGTPLEQISIAHSLARDGETCLSPQAWEYVKDCVIEGSPLEDRPDFHLLLRMDESKYTFPTIKHAAKENDNRLAKQFSLSQLNIIRHFVPSAVFKQIECGTLTYVNEMRHICCVMISGSGLDILAESGPARAQELMVSIQKACYSHEGTLNKFVIDDRGMQFVLVFGLPPLVHTDDPTRAVLSCFDIVKVFKRMELVGRFGITTSQSYCGVQGSSRRMEYTVLGDDVNLAARLMANAPKNCILCDTETKERVSGEIVMNELAPIIVAGRSEPVQNYLPVQKEPPFRIGVTTDGKIRFPWYDSPYGGAGGAQQMNVQQLCSVTGWSGIQKVEKILGAAFHVDVHDSENVITRGNPTERAPPGSPLEAGGVVVLESDTGVGKIQLAEHLVTYAALKFQTLPVFATMGPRPGDSVRMANELLRSTISVYRFMQPNLPDDEFSLLQAIIPPNLTGHIPAMRAVLVNDDTKDQADLLSNTLDVVMGLITVMLKTTAMTILLQIECGTTLFAKSSAADEAIFWASVEKLTTFIKREKLNKATKPVTIVIMTRTAKRDSAAIKLAEETASFLSLRGLENDAINEYISNYLTVPFEFVSGPLKAFVSNVTLGVPLYIRETLVELQENGHVSVNRRANGQVANLEVKDLDKCNIAAWQHTAMVGGTVCLLESLDPLESAVLKMSTCFSGSFTLPDLAASRASKWADAVHFDFLRLYYALNQLRQKKCIDSVDAPPTGNGHSVDQDKQLFGGPQHFQTRNLLIRAIAFSMVLEQQRKSVKRQALVDRALSQKLPARMEVLALKKNAQHIPWYYEQAFRRM